MGIIKTVAIAFLPETSVSEIPDTIEEAVKSYSTSSKAKSKRQSTIDN